MKLYYHKTDGGAKYLCSDKVEGTENEGSFASDYIVRIDGDITKDAELNVRNNIIKSGKIIVEVKGGVAHCNDPRVEIIDHDNREEG